MITREPMTFGDKEVMVLNFVFMRPHEVIKAITDLLNVDEIEDEIQYALDIRAMQQYLIQRGA